MISTWGWLEHHLHIFMFTCSPKAFAAVAKRVMISYMSSWDWATKVVSSANISLWTRMDLVLVVGLNWFTLNKFAPGLDCIVIPLLQPANAQSTTLERKGAKRVGAKTLPCFTPFFTSKGLESSPFRLTEAFMSLSREAMRSANRSGQPILLQYLPKCFSVQNVESLCEVYKYHVQKSVLLYEFFFNLFERENHVYRASSGT